MNFLSQIHLWIMSSPLHIGSRMDKDRFCLGGGLHCLRTVVRDDIVSLYFSLCLHMKCQCLRMIHVDMCVCSGN